MGGGLRSQDCWVRKVPAVAGRSSWSLCMSSSERWEGSSNRFREVKEDEASSWDVTGVKWVRFLFLTICHVWWGGIARPEFRGPFDWDGGVMKRHDDEGFGKRAEAGVASWSAGGGGVIWGLTLDGRSAKLGVVVGRSSSDGAVKLGVLVGRDMWRRSRP